MGRNRTGFLDLVVLILILYALILLGTKIASASHLILYTCNGVNATIVDDDSVYHENPDFYQMEVGNDNRDIIQMNSGKDLVAAQGGNDLVCGSNDDDQLHGDDGNDHIFGGSGDDILEGGNGTDTLNGGNGFDTCSGGETYINCEDIS